MQTVESSNIYLYNFDDSDLCVVTNTHEQYCQCIGGTCDQKVSIRR